MNSTVSIGIFAHNEADCIVDMLQQFRLQSIFSQPNPPEIVVLENGSSDNTAGLAKEALQRFYNGIPSKVESLKIGDKGNTWNEFVHRICSRDSDVLMFVDADIELGCDQTLENLLSGLIADPTARVAVSEPLKDIAKKEQHSGMEKLSLSASTAGRSGPARLAGSLYCGRTEFMRQLCIPRGLLVEDGFIRAMVLTSQFSEPEDVNRMIASPDTCHYFEAVTQPGPLFRHERRLAIGTELNIMLFAWAVRILTEGKDVCEEIRALNETQPGWVRDMALEQLKQGTFEFHTKSYVFKQWHAWKKLDLKSKIRSLPGLLARLGLNMAVVISAKKSLRSGQWQW